MLLSVFCKEYQFYILLFNVSTWHIYLKGVAQCRRPLRRSVTSELQRSGKGNAGLFYICYVFFPWNEFSGTLPTRLNEIDPYGQGGMLAFFYQELPIVEAGNFKKETI